jgi:hypothetical protein
MLCNKWSSTALLRVVGLALVESQGVAVGIGDEGHPAKGEVLDSHDDFHVLGFEVGDGRIEVMKFQACPTAVRVRFPLLGGFGQGQCLAGEIVFEPAKIPLVLEGDGFLQAEDFAVKPAGVTGFMGSCWFQSVSFRRLRCSCFAPD